ncbi:MULTISPECIES: PTS sugar transporter subunit IIA [unclassified Streptomyces]|uniref:PTS sugar transporter subunit IIA n=1 Tax=unclassified Streptomyces TaxID=2593676 RepID=UPI0022B642DC|nr:MULTISPECIES: PTS glucose transporter subunit IIA [unclassified Streptomyces]MCZ7415558.1 PTS glucose transporter subunit IIA [Streptomyces sp. WMMC897]MCZ7434630.1 PTS glucose transporter subunit IIA [Streptomyces sp. WMMC1477]
MTTVSSPLAGRVIGLGEVPDPVFSGAMVGPGTAVDPLREPCEALAPVDGLLVSLHAHAFVVVDAEGHGVLVHLGIDTVQLGGTGFELLAAKGDSVLRGDPLVRWDPTAVVAAGKSPVSPVVALEATRDALADLVEGGVELHSGDVLFTWN